MDHYAEGDLRIEVVPAPDAVRLLWSGKGNARDPGVTLHPFFAKVADHAKTRKRRVEMRLNELEYFNSSTLAAIIRAVRLVRDQGTPIVITYQRESGWQRRSCEALRVLEIANAVEIRGV